MREKLPKSMELYDYLEKKDKLTALFFKSQLEKFYVSCKNSDYFYLSGFLRALRLTNYISEQLFYDAADELIKY